MQIRQILRSAESSRVPCAPFSAASNTQFSHINFPSFRWNDWLVRFADRSSRRVLSRLIHGRGESEDRGTLSSSCWRIVSDRSGKMKCHRPVLHQRASAKAGSPWSEKFPPRHMQTGMVPQVEST